MKRHVYNIALGVGVLLFASGTLLYSVPLGLTATGVLVIGLTLFGARAAGRAG